MIKNKSIKKLKNSVDIVEVIGEYMALKKAGANLKACCPFHNENAPSFIVSPSKQIYHCFGCGATGDSIQFVMAYKKLSYQEAVAILAHKYEIKLKYSS